MALELPERQLNSRIYDYSLSNAKILGIRMSYGTSHINVGVKCAKYRSDLFKDEGLTIWVEPVIPRSG